MKTFLTTTIAIFLFVLTCSAQNPWSETTPNVYLTTPGNKVGIGTQAPGALLDMSSATGSATIIPTTLNITSTTNASDWDITQPWGTINFYSKDASSLGASPRAGIWAFMQSNTGGAGELGFFTNNGTVINERMRLDYTGKLGIGTTSPGTQLEVIATAASSGIRSLSSAAPGTGGGGGLMAVTSTPTASGQRLGLLAFGGITTGSTYNYAAQVSGYASEAWSPTAAGSYLSFRTTPNTTISTSERMRITDAGYVGIGTTNPVRKVEIANSTLPALRLTNTSTSVAAGGSFGEFDFYGNDSSTGGVGITGFFKSVAVNSGVSSALTFGTRTSAGGDAAEVMRIDNAGSVSIGTTDPQGYKFAVNGSAIATSMTVKLYANWPDFVFKTTYKLPSLADVKTYIDQNHHLPEIPSAAEVAKNGQNLGEMNTLLLKKVEELTLYMIELNKTVKAQQEEINRLKSGKR